MLLFTSVYFLMRRFNKGHLNEEEFTYLINNIQRLPTAMLDFNEGTRMAKIL